MSELKPCRFCGSERTFAKYLGEHDYSVRCRNCSAWGPDAPTEKDAIARWNDCTAGSPSPIKTLRDEFAMAALAGLDAALGCDVEIPHEDAAKYAYGRADAMMKEREKADD